MNKTWFRESLFAIFLAVVSVFSPCEASELFIGAETVSITPEQPVALSGQMHTRIANEVDSEVTATVLVMESRDGEQTLDHVIMVSCDLVGIRGGILEAVRDRIRGRLQDVHVNKIVFNATHTHTAPVMIEGRYTLPEKGIIRPKEYVEFFADQVSGAIVKAWESRQRGSVGWGLGHAMIAYNRRALYTHGRAQMYGPTNSDDFRGIEGYEDHGIEVLFFWNANKELIATAVNVACPSQAVEGLSNVNADFWHPVRQSLRAKYGKNLNVLGWTGASGDHAPRPMYRKQAEARMRKLRGVTLLEELSRRVVAGWEEAYVGAKQEMHSDALLVHNVKTIEIPLRKVTASEYESAKKTVASLANNPAKIWMKNWKQAVVDRFDQMKAGTAKPYPMQLHTIRIGDVAIATNDFELFTDFGTQMKARSPALQTFVIQLCGPGTYVPNARAVRGGSYSAIVESSVVGPIGGQVLTERTVESLKQLFADPETGAKP